MIDISKDRMSSSERMKALFAGEKHDRVPFIPFALGFAALLSGYEIYDYYADPAKSFRAQLLCKEVLSHDGSPMFTYASFGAWEFGGEIKYPETIWDQSPMVTKPAISSPQDVKNLVVPDLRTAGYIPKEIEFVELAHKKGLPIFLKLGTPFTTAGSVIGEPLMLRWMIRKPDLVHEVLQKVTLLFINIAKFFVDKYGPERIVAFDASPTEANDVISARQFEEFALPYLVQAHQVILQMGVPRFLTHVCGDQNMNLELWQKVPMGRGGVMSFGHEVDLTKAIEMFGKDVIIAGNVNSTLLQLGPPEEVYTSTKECLRKGMKSPRGYVLMPGCELPPRSPFINVYYMRKALSDFGYYD